MNEESAKTWVPLCPTEDVWADCGKRVEVQGHVPLAVFRLEDEFFVIADTCTHGDASLCDGYLAGGEIECPWHSGRFDIRSGAATAYPATDPIRVFKACVRDGQVHALLP